MSRRFKDILVEYGIVALVVHYTIGACVAIGIYIAMRTGWEPRNAAQSVGMWAATYGVYKATMPIRIPITLIITPFVARVYERVTGRRPGNLVAMLAPPVAAAERGDPVDAA